MLKNYVALDLETTGLDPGLDSIIEVGMIRVREGVAAETYHTLLRPDKKIPLRIKNLTGIDEGMVTGAPQLHQVREAIAGFIGGDAILGHGVGFDAAFLDLQLGGRLYSKAYDTLELSRIILPSARSHRLSDLCTSLGLKVMACHRALEDARAALLLFNRLTEIIGRLDGKLALQLDWLLKESGSPWGGIMQGGRGIFIPGDYSLPVSDPSAAACSRRAPGEKGCSGFVDIGRVKDIFSGGGLFERDLPSFQHRPQQAEMASEVARALNEKKILLVEAGTGTGKSLAYLVPSFLWAAAGGSRVVVSTGTINLQDQILHKDIPLIAGSIGLEVRVALVKGRSNYICLRRWRSVMTASHGTGREAAFYARVLVWLGGTQSGDRVELNISGREEEYWMNICADSDDCRGARCRYAPGGCFVNRARREADSAGIIITNHALLFSDIRMGNKVLPDYGPVIIDEAHHLEEAATEQLGRQISKSGVRRLLREAGRVAARLRELVPDRDQSAWADQLISARESITRLRAVSDNFFEMVRDLVYRETSSGEGDQLSFRIGAGGLSGGPGDPLWAEYGNLTFEFRTFLQIMAKMTGMMQSWEVENDSWAERIKETLSLSFAGEEMLECLEFNFGCRERSFVYWVSVSGQGDFVSVSLNSSPIRVGELLHERLFSKGGPVVLTSATLTVNGSFDFISERVGVDRVFNSRLVFRRLESPFLYERQSLLCIVNDLPVQGQEAGGIYVEAVGRAMEELVEAVGGKTLALFTSHRVLREVHRAVGERMEEKEICVLGHGIDGNRTRLVEDFKKPGRMLLMGASSFWEGIDIPGEALSCVIIVKLPFLSPSDPVLEARMENLEEDGRNSFYEYYLPLAAIRFKQGFGRLIRSESDRGVVVVLDRRLLDRKYGRFFMGSIPAGSYFGGSLKKVREKIMKWNKEAGT